MKIITSRVVLSILILFSTASYGGSPITQSDPRTISEVEIDSDFEFTSSGDFQPLDSKEEKWEVILDLPLETLYVDMLDPMAGSLSQVLVERTADGKVFSVSRTFSDVYDLDTDPDRGLFEGSRYVLEEGKLTSLIRCKDESLRTPRAQVPDDLNPNPGRTVSCVEINTTSCRNIAKNADRVLIEINEAARVGLKENCEKATDDRKCARAIRSLHRRLYSGMCFSGNPHFEALNELASNDPNHPQFSIEARDQHRIEVQTYGHALRDIFKDYELLEALCSKMKNIL